MNKVMLFLITLFIASTISVGAAPDYAKWGTLAMKEAQQRYQADIIDYKHIGRTDFSAQKSEEKFKLWLKNKEGKEFGVYVYIEFDPSNDKIQRVRFVETIR